MSVHVGNHACKKADMHITNKNMIQWEKMYQISIKTCGSEKWPICFSPVYCSFQADYTILVYMMTALQSCTLLT